MQVDHHSFFYFFVFFYLYFIPSFHSTSFDFFLFSSHDVWIGFSIHTLFLLIRCVHSFIITFRVGTPRSGTQDVSVHCISCMRGMGIIIIGIFEPSFLLFLSLYFLSLRYIPRLKTALSPWLHTLCLIAHTWAILEIGWRLFRGAWWIRSYDMI